jgi:hypothetical protein
MFLTKLKAAAAVLLAVALAGTGTGVLAYHTATDQPGPAAGAQPNQPPATADAARIARLVEQLGSDVFAERQKATKELEEIGAPALDALRQAAQGGDPERRKRAEELIFNFQWRLEATRLLAAKRVHLVYKDTPLADAVADFKAKSGYDIALSDPDGKLKDRKVTLDTGDVTFWKALDLFCRQAGVVEAAPPGGLPPVQGAGGMGGVQAGGRGGGGGGGRGAMPGGLPPAGNAPIGSGSVTWPYDGSPALPLTGRVVLTDGRAPTLPTDDRSVVRVRATKSTVSLTGGQGEIALALETAAEPRLRWQQVLAVRVGKAIDDQGRSLEPIATGDEPPVPPRGGGSTVAGLGRSITVEGGPGLPARVGPTSVRLKTNGQIGKSLVEVSGTLTAQVAEETQPLISVDDVLKSAGQTIKGAAGGSLAIMNVTQHPNGPISVSLELDPPADVLPVDGSLRLSRSAGRILMSKSGAGAPGAANLELALVDDKGQMLHPVGLTYRLFAGKGPEYVITWQPAVGQGEVAKLVVCVRKSVTIDVPFTLRNVPLP